MSHQAKTRLRLVKCRITRLLTLADEVERNPSRAGLFKATCTDLHQLKSDFEENHMQLAIQATETESLVESEASERELEEFDEAYYRIQEVFNKLTVNETGQNKQRNQIAKTSSNVKLPKLQLPEFKGLLTDWPTFYDLFTSLVHNNEGLSDVEKHQYLLTSLSGEPFNLVKTLPLSKENYILAWQTLVDRYHNVRAIANMHWDNIVQLPRLSIVAPDKLRNMVDILKENLGALKVLKLPVTEWSFVLLNLMLPKLDPDTRNQFEIAHKNVQMPTFNQLLEFMELQSKALMMSNYTTAVVPAARPFPKRSLPQNPNFKSSFLVTAEAETCSACGDMHRLHKCPVFTGQSNDERIEFVRRKMLCFNCLQGHRVKDCRSRRNCYHCSRRHHSLLHTAVPNQEVKLPAGESTQEITMPQASHKEDAATVVSLTSSTAVSTTVVLGTAMVRVQDASGMLQNVRALLDSGSQSSFITEECVHRLGLKCRRAKVPVVGLAHSVVVANSGAVTCFLTSCKGVGTDVVTDALVLKNIAANLPTIPLPHHVRDMYRHLELADPSFDTPRAIDILLGADVYPDVFDGGRYQPSKGVPVALHSIFGWVIMGKVTQVADTSSSGVVSMYASSDTALTDTIRKFWETEELPSVQHSSPEDTKCENHFVETHSRNPEGRFVLRLPFKERDPDLGDTRSHAVKRLRQLESRLHHQPEAYTEYCKFLREYEQLGHMHCLDNATDQERRYYIPHHYVCKESSSTTRLRVVFDASTRSTSGKSLNDVLMTGPKLQNDIVDIITHFRLHRVVLTTDICKMYRQVLVHPDDAPYQVILWREKPDQPIREFQLDTVTYGVSAAPFMAMRALQQLAMEEGPRYPMAARVVMEDVFVDDIVTGAASVTEALALQQGLINLLKQGGFELRKWSSNSKAVLDAVPEDHRESPLSFHGSNEVIKVLGLQWDWKADVFSYHVQHASATVTKRSILSEIARLYDPLGWITPVIIRAKIFLQRLWLLGVSWDETPPLDLVADWQVFIGQLDVLSNLSVPRLVSAPQSEYQLHGFSDASNEGYAAVVYLRTTSQGETKSHLLLAKSRVAPLKTVTLPRLELQAALLLIKLIESLIITLSERIHISSIYAWCDSTVVLAWIKIPPHQLKTFVANRVSRIQESKVPVHWRHVSSAENAADCASRGLSPKELLTHPLWWTGPGWLTAEVDLWPSQGYTSSEEVKEELKAITLVSLVGQCIPNILNTLCRFSSWSRLQRVLAYVLRFALNLKVSRELRHTGPLTVAEIDAAKTVCLKQLQQEHFKLELDCLAAARECSSGIKRLQPFIDADGIIRVGGRLQNSHVAYGMKHQVLLPKRSFVTEMIIDYYHALHLHAGPSATHAAIRCEYWIVAGRGAVKTRIHACVKCYRFRATNVQPSMGNLPPSRVQQTRPFLNVGVDYGGPFQVRLSNGRNSRSSKAYLCLFICLATKAVHLEVVSSLSTTAFLNAFFRFMARRGLCKAVFSDCGTNFIGARRYFNDLQRYLRNTSNWHCVADTLATRGIQWNLNPPSAPHFGGLWEASIKSAKYHLKRVVGQQILTFEELSTLFTQIEAVLNSRPLCAISSDPNDVEALTPAHFLVGTSLTSPPAADLTEIQTNRLDRWQLVQSASQHFWKRWHKEYLHTLQPRGKWTKSEGDLQVGDLVLIKEDHLPPLQWQLGRVTTLQPGQDGVSRVATLKQQHRVVKRPVIKLCRLPVN